MTDITDDSSSTPIKSLIDKPWKYKERLGRDTHGLQHRGIKVKHVLRVDNEKLLKQYDKAVDMTLTSPYPDELTQEPILTTILQVAGSDNDAEVSTQNPLSPESQGNLENIILSESQESLNHTLPHGSQGNSDTVEPFALSGTEHIAEVKINIDEVSENHGLLITDGQNDLRPGEVYLIHGTKLENIPSILEHGFDLGRAKPGLYGKAIYLAESSEKADQYSGKCVEIQVDNEVIYSITILRYTSILAPAF